ncbi:hypothetical protein AI27_00930 [Sphingomonas sp. BHC-A]|nr:hypothetical protein AI27_00930 [Sphingomonas sp. BHC-A]
MKRVECYGDSRILNGCFHCGAGADTVDHAPPKILLDKPYPDEMIVVPSCYACNNSASLDESWLACVVECVVTGEVEPERVSRPAIAKILAHSPALAASMLAIRTIDETGTTFSPDMDRVRRIVTKVARAHAAYELHEHFEHEPASVEVFPLIHLSEEALQEFESMGGGFAMWPEVGSRAMQRLLEGYPGDRPGWVVVQKGRYRYMAGVEDGRVVRMVLSEYLGCKVVWDY